MTLAVGTMTTNHQSNETDQDARDLDVDKIRMRYFALFCFAFLIVFTSLMIAALLFNTRAEQKMAEGALNFLRFAAVVGIALTIIIFLKLAKKSDAALTKRKIAFYRDNRDKE